MEAAFHAKNRARLRKHHAGLIVVVGNSFVQASNDRTFPFEQDAYFLYLTGVTEPEAVLVMDEHEEYIVIPDRDVTRTAFEGAIDVAGITAVSGITRVKTRSEAWEQLIARIASEGTVATLQAPTGYIESHEMFTNPSRAHFLQQLGSDVEVRDLREALTHMRMVKAPYEIKMIKQAIEETVKLFKIIERTRNKANFEHDLAAEIAKVTVKNQATNAYEPIIASGKNAITLHYVKNNAPLDKTSMLLLDIGLRYKGYSADITRTVSFMPSQRQRDVFDAVLAVHAFALSILKPGITLKEYELQVQDCMTEQLKVLGLIGPLREYYPHATSHHLGLDVHDVADYQMPLQPNMVITVEPGIYIAEENIGIRLEDDVQITKDGAKVLSSTLPKHIDSLTL